IHKSQVRNFKTLMLKNGFMLLPLILIIGTVMIGYTPQRAAIIGIATAYLVSLIRKDTRLSFRKLIDVFEQGARVALPVIAAVATAGIIAGVVSITGLGAKFAAGIISLSGGSLFLALIFTMVACIVLGMGLPTTANYVVTATVAAPALINGFDLPPISVHMFVFYFGIVADITPPVSLAAYAGAGIARANPFKSGIGAVKLAIAAFIIPYIFIYNPILVLVDATIFTVITGVTTAVLGMAGISGALIGYFNNKTTIIERIMLFAGGLFLIVPEFLSSLIGIVILVAVWIMQSKRPKEYSEDNSKKVAQI